MKKHLSLILALAMVIAMFTACGSTGNSSSSGADKSETTATSEAAAPEATDAAPAETDAASDAEETSTVEKVDSSALYPVSEETIHLTGVAPQEPMLVSYQEDLSQEYAQVTAEEKTNVSVDWNISNVDTYTDNITIMLSSGDIPNLVLTPDNYYSIDYLIEQELFLDLTDYLPTDAPDFYALYQSDEAFAKEITSDTGKLVTMRGRFQLPNSMLGIRQDWLDALNLKTPTTYDELTEVLTALHNEYNTPNTVSFLSTGFMSNYSILTGGFGVATPDMNDLPWQVDDKGNVIMSYTLDGYKEYLELVHSWYEAGLFNDEFLSASNPGVPDSWMVAGETALFATRAASFSASYAGTVDDENFVLACMADVTKTGTETITLGDSRSITANGGMAVAAQCEYPEEAIKYLNWYFTDEGFYACNYGEEGVTYNKNVDGSIAYTDFLLNNPDGLSYKNALGLYTSYYGVGFDESDERTTASFSLETEKVMYDTWRSNRSEANVYHGTLSTEESTEYSSISSDMITLANTKIMGYIMGTESLDTYDEFVETLYSMNLDTLISLKQAAYDRYLAR